MPQPVLLSTQIVMAEIRITPPENFTFSRPEEWTKWIRRFRQASGLAEKEQTSQIHTLIYTMGDEAEDVLTSFRLTEEQGKSYTTVVEKFDGYFVKRRNLIFERAKFNWRRQEEGEPVNDFIMDLYRLAEHCNYGTLHDELIRDRIVVGLRSAALSGKLQRDADLTLEKAVQRDHRAIITQLCKRHSYTKISNYVQSKNLHLRIRRGRYYMPKFCPFFIYMTHYHSMPSVIYSRSCVSKSGVCLKHMPCMHIL